MRSNPLSASRADVHKTSTIFCSIAPCGSGLARWNARLETATELPEGGAFQSGVISTRRALRWLLCCGKPVSGAPITKPRSAGPGQACQSVCQARLVSIVYIVFCRVTSVIDIPLPASCRIKDVPPPRIFPLDKRSTDLHVLSRVSQ